MENSNGLSLEGLTLRTLTLGCKLNFAETATIRDLLVSEGVTDASGDKPADIVIVNTCSVTGEADQKCRQGIRRICRQNPGACTVVTGCYAQLKPDEVGGIEGVTYVMAQREKGEVVARIREHFSRTPDFCAASVGETCPAPRGGETIVGIGKTVGGLNQTVGGLNETLGGLNQTLGGLREGPVAAPAAVGGAGSAGGTAPAADAGGRTERRGDWPFVPSCSKGNRTRYFLKVQDGCNYFCTYCTIPLARGRSRNGSIASLVAQAEEVARQGGREVVLTGVNIGDFGRTTGETFFQLVQALDAVEGIARYRISSIEPNLLSDEIIDFCAQSRAFMPHFHIPLQSGSDEVLRLMRRHYDTALFRHRIERIRQTMPHAFIGVDVIVGARGETEECFRQSRDFLASLNVQQLHVFPYSERPGTKALEIPHTVSAAEKHARSQELIALSETKRLAFYEAHRGQVRPVLWENGAGWTDNYIRVVGAGAPNTLSSVRLGGFTASQEELYAE